MSDEDEKKLNMSSGSSMALGSYQVSINNEIDEAGSDDKDRWDDVESDEEDEGREEGQCDEDNNPIDARGLENIDDVEVLSYS